MEIDNNYKIESLGLKATVMWACSGKGIMRLLNEKKILLIFFAEDYFLGE